MDGHGTWMFSNHGPIMSLRGHHLSHPWNSWLLQVPGMDDSKGLKWIKRPWHAPRASTEISTHFFALLCVRACDSPKRSAPAAVFTCSRSLVIAAFYLDVALWKMESWKDILRIFVDKFSLQVRCILCSWKRNCLTVWIHLQVATPNHSRARPLRGWYVSAKHFAATKRSCNRETVNKQKEPKMYHKKQGLNNHSEEDIKMAGFEAKASSKRFALGFMIRPTVRN